MPDMKMTPLRGAVMIVAVLGIGYLIARQNDIRQTDGPGWEYDLSDYKKIDPHLLKYEEVRKIETGLREVRALALGPDGSIYAGGDRAYEVISADGSRSIVQLNDRPQCLAVGADKTVYVGFDDHVEVFDQDGVRRAKGQSWGDRAALRSIAVTDDDVYITDAGNFVVYRCNKNGELLNKIGEIDKERNIPGLIVPSKHLDCAMAADGLLRLVNPGRHRIEAYTPEGDLEFYWGKASMKTEGFSGCCNPTDIAILPDGRIVTAEKGIPRVKVYRENYGETFTGELTGVVAGPDAFADANIYDYGATFAGFDLATDADGLIYLLDPASKAVRVFQEKQK